MGLENDGTGEEFDPTKPYTTRDGIAVVGLCKVEGDGRWWWDGRVNSRKVSWWPSGRFVGGGYEHCNDLVNVAPPSPDPHGAQATGDDSLRSLAERALQSGLPPMGVALAEGVLAQAKPESGDWQALQSLMLNFAAKADYEPTEAELAALSPEDRGVVKGWRLRGEAMAAEAERVAANVEVEKLAKGLWIANGHEARAGCAWEDAGDMLMAHHCRSIAETAIRYAAPQPCLASPLAGSAEAGGVSDAEVEAYLDATWVNGVPWRNYEADFGLQATCKAGLEAAAKVRP